MASDLPALGFGALTVAPASNASGRAADGAGAYGGGDDAGGAMYWKADIMAQINTRDRVQRENFRPLMDQYERLIRDDKALKARVAQLEKVVAAADTNAAAAGGGSGSGSAQSSPPTPASHMLGAGARGSMSIDTRSTAASLVGGLMNTAASYAGYTPLVASQREKNLEEKVAKLQDELNANYRLSNENSIALLRLKEQAERDEKLILQKEELLAKKQAELDEFVEKSEAGKGRSVQLEATVEVLRKEVVTLQKELAAREDKIKRLTEENERHVNTILKMKDEQAVVMNQMNDHITNLVKDTKQKAAQAAKDAKDKKDADKKISGDIDYSDKNSILDAVSWTSAMDVKVPTSQRRTLYITNGQATTIAYNHSGSLLVSSGTDAVVRIWDTRTGTLRGTLRGATQAVMSASFSANDKMVLATGNDNAARIWSTDTSRQLHVLTGHTGKVYGGAFTGDGERVFTAAHDRTIKVWNVSSGYCKGTINCGSLCNYLGLCAATETLATAHLDTHIRLWSARNNELLHDFEDIHSQQTTCAEFSANGELLVTNSRDNTLNVIDTRIYKVVKTLNGDAKTPYKNSINWGRAVFSPDGSWVVAGASTGSVLVWSMKTGKVETALTPEAVAKAVGHAAAGAAGAGAAAKPTESLPANAITCVAWNPNGRQVASCDNSGKLIFWE